MKKAQWPIENRRKEKLLWQMDTIQIAHSLIHLFTDIYGTHRRGQAGMQKVKLLKLNITVRWVHARKVCMLCGRYLAIRAPPPLSSDQWFLSLANEIHFSLWGYNQEVADVHMQISNKICLIGEEENTTVEESTVMHNKKYGKNPIHRLWIKHTENWKTDYKWSKASGWQYKTS